ncbi:uncharacterized protein V6R79_004572 [Siganus canaliculatus]
MQVALLVISLSAVCNGILPEIADRGITHILEDNSVQGQTELDRTLVEVQQLPKDPQPKSEDELHQSRDESLSPTTNNPHPPSHGNQSDAEKVTGNESAPTSSEEETNNITTVSPSSHLGDNNIDQGCMTDDDCGKGRYCLYDTQNAKCLPCKATDVSCRKDEECCAEQLCVWGQCSENATKGEAGSTCQYQTDCSPDLCCAFHKALMFPVCSAKPIDRERCFGASNHLIELLSWDNQGDGPRKHCPCAGDLRCQHLGRGSMCLKGEDSSEEDLTDTLYSEIDYIL